MNFCIGMNPVLYCLFDIPTKIQKAKKRAAEDSPDKLLPFDDLLDRMDVSLSLAPGEMQHLTDAIDNEATDFDLGPPKISVAALHLHGDIFYNNFKQIIIYPISIRTMLPQNK